MSDIQRVHYRSPCGGIELSVRAGRLIGVRLCTDDGARRRGRGRAGTPAGAARFVSALQRYFRGLDVRLPPEALDLPEAGTLRGRVCRELMRVPFGHVVTYGGLAARIGRPASARAVGQALARNQLPIFVPCHRVVAADSRLGGFSAGLPWKAALLSHEGWTVQEDRLWPGKRTRGNHGRASTQAASTRRPTGTCT